MNPGNFAAISGEGAALAEKGAVEKAKRNLCPACKSLVRSKPVLRPWGLGKHHRARSFGTARGRHKAAEGARASN